MLQDAFAIARNVLMERKMQFFAISTYEASLRDALFTFHGNVWSLKMIIIKCGLVPSERLVN